MNVGNAGKFLGIHRQGGRCLLIFIALICLAQAEYDPADLKLQNILQEKEKNVEQAEQEYQKKVKSAEKDYQRIIEEAEKTLENAVTTARKAAVSRLETLGRELTRKGDLGSAVRIYKAIYALNPEHKQAIRTLKAADAQFDAISVSPEAGPAVPKAVRADRVVLWNTHNAQYNTSGTTICNVVLKSDGKEVWRKDDVRVPWKRNEDTYVSVPIPNTPFTVVRVEVEDWKGYAGGLSEIQVFDGSENLAIKCPVTVSAAADPRAGGSNLTDGNLTSRVFMDGYWMLPDKQPGWAEVTLAKSSYTRMRQYRIIAGEPWQRVTRVRRGDVLEITAEGTWKAAPSLTADADGGKKSGGDEFGFYRDRFYLRGRIGNRMFKVGSRYVLEVQQNGILELGMQEEDPTWYKNNSGSLMVTISFRREE